MFEVTKGEADEMVSFLLKSGKQSILYSSAPTHDISTPNGLRIMFQKEDSKINDVMLPLQIVDSEYVTRKLSQNLLELYSLLRSYTSWSIKGKKRFRATILSMFVH